MGLRTPGAMTARWQPIDVNSDPYEAEYLGDPADLVELIDAASFVAAILHRPAWQAKAACRGKGADRWFPTRGVDLAPAREVCADCTVKDACLAAALEHGAAYDVGVWAGTSARERKQLRRTVEQDAA